MKCGAYVLWVTRGKKNPKRAVSRMISRANQARGFLLTENNIDEYEVCDGEIQVVDLLENDGGCYCCTNYYLQLTYKCNKCGCQDFPQLPHSEDQVTRAMNEMILAMNGDEADGQYKAYLLAEKERLAVHMAKLEKTEKKKKK